PSTLKTAVPGEGERSTSPRTLGTAISAGGSVGSHPGPTRPPPAAGGVGWALTPLRGGALRVLDPHADAVATGDELEPQAANLEDVRLRPALLVGLDRPAGEGLAVAGDGDARCGLERD